MKKTILSKKNNQKTHPIEPSLQELISQVNDTKEKKQNTPSIDSSLQKLTSKAKQVFDSLNEKSDIIRKLENSLQDIKAHFPFKLRIAKEESELKYDLQKHHKQVNPSAQAYVIRKLWFLSWDSDQNSKNYRLFLSCEEREIVVEEIQNFYLPLECVFKKPFIETDLPTRLKYSDNISIFINEFTKHLEKYHRSIEKNDLNLSY